MSLDDWYKKWFYIREEPNTITLCDVGFIPEKRTSWSEKPEHLEQILEIFGMILWKNWMVRAWSGVSSANGSSPARGEYILAMNIKVAWTR